MLIGQESEQALQCTHSLSFTPICKKLTLLNGARIAPTGQKYLHHPLSIVKIKIKNKIKITSAM
jgi:hypothetical protein